MLIIARVFSEGQCTMPSIPMEGGLTLSANFVSWSSGLRRSLNWKSQIMALLIWGSKWKTLRACRSWWGRKEQFKCWENSEGHKVLFILISLHLVNPFVTVTKRFKIHGNKQSEKTGGKSSWKTTDDTANQNLLPIKFTWDSSKMEKCNRTFTKAQNKYKFCFSTITASCIFSEVPLQSQEFILCDRHWIVMTHRETPLT